VHRTIIISNLDEASITIWYSLFFSADPGVVAAESGDCSPFGVFDPLDNDLPLVGVVEDARLFALATFLGDRASPLQD